MATAHPLILTLKLDTPSFVALDRLRKEFFPPQRNFLGAHVTLFHALPHGEQRRIEERLRELSRETQPLSLSFPGPVLLGRGVALDIECPELILLHKRLAAEWRSWLRPQDRQAYRPHVTVQNKVRPEEARRVFDLIAASWEPSPGTGEGLQLWQYRGGPWELIGEFPFGRD